MEVTERSGLRAEPWGNFRLVGAGREEHRLNTKEYTPMASSLECGLKALKTQRLASALELLMRSLRWP